MGTFKIRGADLIHRCLDAALAAGYRSIGTGEVGYLHQISKIQIRHHQIDHIKVCLNITTLFFFLIFVILLLNW